MPLSSLYRCVLLWWHNDGAIIPVMPDFESYEAQEEFRTKAPIAMKWVEAVLKAKGIDSSAIQWRSIGPDVLTLTVEFPKLDREYTR
ncbi:MAG: hypothetical protein HYZ57_16620, partial [Acidobacteria bacterium]|nr:hypothetical protein [Acidobacteriota bacterium]MBI3281456.1 hypothetical protein [Acidobacteriota bacterium]